MDIITKSHFEQFKKLKPYGRYKTITKMYNSKYYFNISVNDMKIYLKNIKGYIIFTAKLVGKQN